MSPPFLTRYNALQRALQRVAARLNAFKRNATQCAAVVEIDLYNIQGVSKNNPTCFC